MVSAGSWRALQRVVFFCLIILIGGCGYHFNGVAESMGGIRKIYVDNFPNRTDEAYLENIFRNALIDQIIRGNRFQVVGDETEADAVVRGTIQQIRLTHVAYENADLAAEERLNLTMHIVLEDRETGKILWEDRSFSGTEDYIVMNRSKSDIAAYSGKRKALNKLSGDMAERAYRLMISDF